MVDRAGTYDARFYDAIRPGAQASAAAIVPLVLDLATKTLRVIDVGCGEGWWANAFAAAGCRRVVGLDGDHVPPERRAHGVEFVECDLAQRIESDGSSFDLAVSLEVAEHLPAERASSFVADLCALAPVVLFSAAVPGQGGAGHVNEQWPSYWIARFAEQEYILVPGLREFVWDDERVEPWYAQNLLVFRRADLALPRRPAWVREEAWPVDLVHPTIFGWRVEEAHGG